MRTEIYRDDKAIYDGGWEPLVARADEALYRAKGAGRNRVERQIDP